MNIKYINFLKYRHFFIGFSVLVLVAGIFVYFAKSGFKYNVDFAGGAEIRVSFEKNLDISLLREVLNKKGWQEPVIQSVGSSQKDFLIRVGGSAENLENRFRADIESFIPDNKMTISNIDVVGAEVGKEAQFNAVIAVILSLLILLLYIAIRTKFSYAVGAVIALIHDLSIVLVFILLLGEPMSLNILAALLTILGYSLNDTIVIFSRIRENVKKFNTSPDVNLVNDSINQTLKRTLLTSFFTLMAVTAFYFLGGEALRSFSLVMIIGIVFGTYSSIYIASPAMLLVNSLMGKNKTN